MICKVITHYRSDPSMKVCFPCSYCMKEYNRVLYPVESVAVSLNNHENIIDFSTKRLPRNPTDNLTYANKISI